MQVSQLTLLVTLPRTTGSLTILARVNHYPSAQPKPARTALLGVKPAIDPNLDAIVMSLYCVPLSRKDSSVPVKLVARLHGALRSDQRFSPPMATNLIVAIRFFRDLHNSTCL